MDTITVCFRSTTFSPFELSPYFPYFRVAMDDSLRLHCAFGCLIVDLCDIAVPMCPIRVLVAVGWWRQGVPISFI